MSRIYSLYLADIVECCERIAEYVQGATLDSFMTDRKTVDAVVRNFEIIGEAAKNLPVHIRDTQPEIDWKRIMRLRDLIAHHYFDINYQRVWGFTQTKLKDLEEAARAMLETSLETEADELE